jgi:predicted Zn-dependent protease
MRHGKEVLASLLALAVFGLACATNPVTGKKEISFVSESQEIAAGKQSLAATEAEYGYYEDAAWTTKVNTMGQKLASVSHRPDLEWQFHVIDDASVNAFAAPAATSSSPAGSRAPENEAQLAGVLGHEIGHVTARHYASAASSRRSRTSAWASPASCRPRSPSSARGVDRARPVLPQVQPRPREPGRPAGVDYSVKAGWDARQMAGTYETLARISATSGSTLPTYLSTHPDPAARQVTVSSLAAKAVGTRTDLKVVRDAYIRALDGMVFGEDPQEGYFEGDRFYHPGLEFQMDFPSGWKHQNSRQTVMAGSGQTSVMQLTMVATNTCRRRSTSPSSSRGEDHGAQGRARPSAAARVGRPGRRPGLPGQHGDARAGDDPARAGQRVPDPGPGRRGRGAQFGPLDPPADRHQPARRRAGAHPQSSRRRARASSTP